MPENVLALGPFVGSWEEEILTFRPHMEWIKRSVPHTDVYISSHSNRDFLYEDKFIPINTFLTRTELKQSGYIHDDVDQVYYNKLVRQLKSEVAKQSGVSKKNIDHYSLPYIKYNTPISVYQKCFKRIKFEPREERVVFIPAQNFNKTKSIKIYEYLSDEFGAVSVGDLNCNIPETNILLTERVDYTLNGFRELINIISSAKAVITPCSFWTALCNIQGTPVLSWGKNLGQYKQGGIYNFNNTKCKTMYYDRETKIENIIKQISYFLESL